MPALAFESPPPFSQLAARLRAWARLVWLVAALAGPGAAAALPLTLVSVSGVEDDFQFLSQDQAAAVAFTLDRSYASVSISARVGCVGCSGVFMLMKDNIGPSADLSDLIDARFYDVNSTTDPIMTLTNLDAGTYFLILPTPAIVARRGGLPAPRR